MELETLALGNLQNLEVDVLAVGMYEDAGLGAYATEIDTLLGGLLQKLAERGDLSGKRYKVTPVLGATGLKANQLVIVGLGKRAEFDRLAAFRAGGVLARTLGDRQRGTIALAFDQELASELWQAAIVGAHVGGVGQDLYRTERTRFSIERLMAPVASADLQAAKILGEAINLTRRLVNEPPSHLTPIALAAEAENLARECGLGIEIWDERQLAEEGCGALLAVARGSAAAPRLVILRYQGTGTGETTALVGKGVTFDSGGLSLKPTDSMKTMKCDMAGAATVLGTMQAIAKLQLPINVIGLMGLVENMPSHNAFRLGDVLTARNGKTIEVQNTDAEGRLVLADVLCVAVDQGADRIIDLATLTGACMVALGTDVAGVMTNDQDWCNQLLRAADRTGERLWQLPMFAEYSELIKSDVADMKNVGNGRWGGAITAAKLLEEFVSGVPWIHIDIAGPAFLERPKSWMDAGGTGTYLLTLVETLAR